MNEEEKQGEWNISLTIKPTLANNCKDFVFLNTYENGHSISMNYLVIYYPHKVMDDSGHMIPLQKNMFQILISKKTFIRELEALQVDIQPVNEFFDAMAIELLPMEFALDQNGELSKPYIPFRQGTCEILERFLSFLDIQLKLFNTSLSSVIMFNAQDICMKLKEDTLVVPLKVEKEKKVLSSSNNPKVKENQDNNPPAEIESQLTELELLFEVESTKKTKNKSNIAKQKSDIEDIKNKLKTIEVVLQKFSKKKTSLNGRIERLKNKINKIQNESKVKPPKRVPEQKELVPSKTKENEIVKILTHTQEEILPNSEDEVKIFTNTVVEEETDSSLRPSPVTNWAETVEEDEARQATSVEAIEEEELMTGQNGKDSSSDVVSTPVNEEKKLSTVNDGVVSTTNISLESMSPITPLIARPYIPPNQRAGYSQQVGLPQEPSRFQRVGYLPSTLRNDDAQLGALLAYQRAHPPILPLGIPPEHMVYAEPPMSVPYPPIEHYYNVMRYFPFDPRGTYGRYPYPFNEARHVMAQDQVRPEALPHPIHSLAPRGRRGGMFDGHELQHPDAFVSSPPTSSFHRR